ncbi:MAG: hypothetical protein HKN24_11065 [Acidimicrobiales bacterium]|nr:hypothetical protein [Acidimicrobiales bacterium]
MRWSTDPAWDRFEPYVGAVGGSTQEQASAAPIADQYHITFSEPVSHLTPVVSRRASLQPDVFFLDDHTLVVSIPGGTTIGDGVDTRIRLLPHAGARIRGSLGQMSRATRIELAADPGQPAQQRSAVARCRPIRVKS